MRHLAFALPLLFSLAACSATTPQIDANGTPDGTDTSGFQPTVQAGMPVYVNRGGQWLPASVVRQTAARNVLIHYEGMPAEWDEDVAFERVRAREGAATPAAPAFAANEVVLVTTQNRLVLGEIVQPVDGGNYRVHYSGWGPEAVENVPPARIQKPFAGATAHPAGAAVLVDAGQPQPLAAKILAPVAADKWLVRFDVGGPQYDQVIAADRIRRADAAVTPPAPTGTATVQTPPATSGTATAGKPPEKTPPATSAPAALKAGDAVVVLVRTVYYPAKIVGAGAAAGSFKVRVEGASADEEVTSGSVTRLQDPLKGVKYQPGQAVFMEWHGVYAPGKVVKEAGGGAYKIRPEGKGAEADEVLPAARLRPR